MQTEKKKISIKKHLKKKLYEKKSRFKLKKIANIPKKIVHKKKIPKK